MDIGDVKIQLGVLYRKRDSGGCNDEELKQIEDYEIQIAYAELPIWKGYRTVLIEYQGKESEVEQLAQSSLFSERIKFDRIKAILSEHTLEEVDAQIARYEELVAKDKKKRKDKVDGAGEEIHEYGVI